MKTKMKKNHFWAFSVCLLFLGIGNAIAQTTESTKENRTTKEVQRHTIMEKFAPDISLTATERQQKRLDRIAEIELRKSVIDTLDISERRRQKLLIDLKYNPFSERLNRTMADIKFEDDMNE
ncbi:hypothetical protein [Maribacter sp. 2-571]|uniref:hypothetical protein n=1 Tax=Maribacter sp. 2-571 TaxID=3417569 RepID=UPI003D345794